MKTYEVTAKKKVGEEEVEVTVNTEFGETAEESIAAFGADVVNTNFIANAKITLQAAVRRGIERGQSADQIRAELANWKPGVSIQRSVDPIAAMMAAFALKSPEEQKEIMAQLKQRAAGK